jgi:hypothetical protein
MMNKFLMGSLVAVVAAVSAGCGGGSDGSADAQAARDARSAAPAAANEWRARAGAAGTGGTTRAQAVSAEAAAEQLFEFAEPAYPAFFPAFVAGSPATQYAAPFRFRLYPNGVYLGVVVSPAEGYILDGVYMMGGPFGDVPLYVGMLGEFITPEARAAGTNPAETPLIQR